MKSHGSWLERPSYSLKFLVIWWWFCYFTIKMCNKSTAQTRPGILCNSSFKWDFRSFGQVPIPLSTAVTVYTVQLFPVIVDFNQCLLSELAPWDSTTYRYMKSSYSALLTVTRSPPTGTVRLFLLEFYYPWTGHKLLSTLYKIYSYEQ